MPVFNPEDKRKRGELPPSSDIARELREIIIRLEKIEKMCRKVLKQIRKHKRGHEM